MPSYAKMWSVLVSRAVRQGGISTEAFVAQALATGMSEDAVFDALDDDLTNNGPIFGAFFSGLHGAAASSVTTATRQGELVGHIDGDAELKRLVNLANADDALDEAIRTADPNLSEALEDVVADDVLETSIAELVKTCHRCLPLHGRTMTRRQWQESGLLPEQRHSGWTSACKCRLVPAGLVDGRDDLVAPLIRERGPKGTKRTARLLSQTNLDKALAARDKSLEDEKGRRTLRLLGQQGANSNADEET